MNGEVPFQIEGQSLEELVDAWVTFLGPLPRQWSHHRQRPGAYDCLCKHDSPLRPKFLFVIPFANSKANEERGIIELTACGPAKPTKPTYEAVEKR